MTDNPGSVPHEVEGTLLLLPPEPAGTAADVASLRLLGPYLLIPRETEELHDRYFDTEDRRLAAHRVALRVRASGDGFVITVKSGEDETDGVSDRFELEAPWSESALQAAIERLRWQGIHVSLAAAGSNRSIDERAPIATLRGLGFDVVQDRRTTRRPRDVLEPVGAGRPGPPLAELAVDAVRYRFEGVPVRVFDVEVEAKGAGPDLVGRVLRELAARYANRLRPWPHSKLATGFALRELSEEGDLGHHLGPTGVLEASGVEAVDALIRTRPPVA